MAKIYEPKGKAREYSQLALNYFKGCDHGCKYCYARIMYERFNPGKKFSEVDTNINFKELKKSAEKYMGCGKQILLQFMSDPYCNANGDQTREVLEILNFYGHKVSILTKGGMRCLKDISIFKKFGDRIKIGASLTFDNYKDSLKWEPGAQTPDLRLYSLKILKENGIKTWASLEPVIYPRQSLNMLLACRLYVDHVKIGKLNNYQGLDKKIDWTKFLDDAVKICREYGIKFYIKKDLAAFNKNTFLQSHEIDQDHLNL